jgi:hypothetical protein
MSSTTYTTGPAPTAPLLWPVLRVLARTRPVPQSPQQRPGMVDTAPDPRLPLRFGDSYRWPDGTWTFPG